MRWRKKKKRMRSIKAPLFVVLVLCAVSMAAGDKKNSGEDTVVAGTVFRVPGFALPGATVTLVRRDDPKHKKVAELTTSPRGEFSIHVPATPMVYVVKAAAKGFRTEEKEASVTGLYRIDLMFTLEPETKK